MKSYEDWEDYKERKITCSKCGEKVIVQLGSLCYEKKLCVNCFKKQDGYFKK